MAYEIRVSPEASDTLRTLSAFDRKTIQAEIRIHLTHEPTKTSRSRIKKLDDTGITQYRLRVGEYRVYYNVNVDEQIVFVMLVFEKGRGLTPEVETS